MIPLHIHTNYSFLSGTPRIDELILFAKKFNLPSMAITDTNSMHGIIQFAKRANE